MNHYRYLLLSALLVLTLSTAKADLSILPFDKDSFTELKNERKDKPFILVFWSESCSYCMQELALFGTLYKQYPDVELVVVATDFFVTKETVKEVLKRSQLELKQTWVFADQFAETIYYKVNKSWRGELPATHFFGRDNQEIRHIGIVKKDKLISWLTEQSTYQADSP